jgi:hypothetical protein
MILQELLQLNEGKLKPSVIKLAKAYVEAEAANPESDETHALYDDFVSAYDQEQNSAISVWMNSKDMKALIHLIAAGKDVRNVIGDPNEFGYNGKLEQMRRQGYKLFSFEDNYDQAEAILYK